MADFSGFPKGTFTFLRGLSKNNDKAWFDAHRAEYDEFYVDTAKAFVAAAGAALEKVDRDIGYAPKIGGSIFRINRDVRFSKDKSPYKGHLMFRFWNGADRKRSASAFYLRFDASSCGIGCGSHMFDKPTLTGFRDAVVDKKAGAALLRAASAIERAGFELEGTHYKKVPKGYEAEGRRAELLKHKGLWIGRDEKLPRSIGKAEFVDHCVEAWTAMKPLHQWMVKNLGG